MVQREPLHHLEQWSMIKATWVSWDKLIHAVLLCPVSIYSSHSWERKGEGVGSRKRKLSNSKENDLFSSHHKAKHLEWVFYGKSRTLSFQIVNLQQKSSRVQSDLANVELSDNPQLTFSLDVHAWADLGVVSSCSLNQKLFNVKATDGFEEVAQFQMMNFHVFSFSWIQ